MKTLGASALALRALGGTVYAQREMPPFPQMKDPKYRNWSEAALKAAKSLGCTYADIRFTRNRAQTLNVRNGQLTSGFQGFGGFGGGGGGGGGADGGVTETYGFGVRVIHSGVWGFASSPVVTPEEITRIVNLATEVAKASAIAKKVDVRLTPVQAYDTFWEGPIEKDPFEVPLGEKIDYLAAITATMQKNKDVRFATAQAGVKREWKFLATSEGSFIEQNIYYSTCQCSATARIGGQTKIRTYSGDSQSRGWEHVLQADMPKHAERVAAEAVEHAMAKPVGAGVKDLVILPSHMQLTIHEIVAHPTELDRVVC